MPPTIVPKGCSSLYFVNEMALESKWSNSQTLTRYLAQRKRTRSLALYLGAGASVHYGLPTWEQVVNRLEASLRVPNDPGLSDILDRAQRVKDVGCGGDFTRFRTAVHRALYEGFKSGWEKQLTDSLMASIAALARPDNEGGHVEDLLTLNWDNLAELYLHEVGATVQSVVSPNFRRNASTVRVFHPQGYLPFEGAQSDRLVFARDSYAPPMGDQANPWTGLVESVTAHTTCIFIGQSGSDESVMSSFARVRDKHPAITTERLPFWGVSMGPSNADARARWAAVGIYYWEVSDYEVDLPARLRAIAKHSHGLDNERSRART